MTDTLERSSGALADTLAQRFEAVVPDGIDYVSLRYMGETAESILVRQGVLEPVDSSDDAGAMLTVYDGGGMGYAATVDLSEAGLAAALQQARDWAAKTAGRTVVDFAEVPKNHPTGEYVGPMQQAWESVPLGDKIAMLTRLCEQIKTDDRIVDWYAGLTHVQTESILITNGGGRLRQVFNFIFPGMAATANEGSETQRRSFGAYAMSRQGGLEVLDQVGFKDAPARLGREAVELLTAPNCPSETMDLLLAPDQMILQIHESIGHPVELDRILGDERNYAGTSFVTLDMFGSYQYGSELLNVTYDPTRPEQMASYGYDDDGAKADKDFIIKDGILVKPLGGTISQSRAEMAGVATGGVANTRASSWNRPPIDRMANLNVEPGDATLDEMISSVERGIYMHTNSSWSIDDSRNKFQFGCEYAQLIENGELTTVVKNPNYRGISATFWRNLKMVGGDDTFTVMGTPNCGKGEPNQVIRVGHASPACLFGDVDVFGGE